MKFEDLHFHLQETDFSIIEKPPGISCHNGTENLQIILKEQGLFLVHRLDQETSGLLMLTPDVIKQAALQQAMRLGTKEYIAILRGKLPPSEHWRLWNTPLTDRAESRTNPQGRAEDRQNAETHYRCESNNDYFSLVYCRLQTGRQHQIRKHSVLAGRAVVGDPRYGSAKDNERIAQTYGFKRLALHAHRLKFIWDEKTFEVISPMPSEFEKLLKASKTTPAQSQN